LLEADGVGLLVGASVGASDGLPEGDGVGLLVVSVGAFVELFEGTDVGAFVGLLDGGCVGLLVGAAVGLSDGFGEG